MISNTLASDPVESGNEPSDLRIQKNCAVDHSNPEKRSHPTGQSHPTGSHPTGQKQPEENMISIKFGEIVDKLVISSYHKDLPSQSEQAVARQPDLLPEEIKAFIVQQRSMFDLGTIKKKQNTTQSKHDRDRVKKTMKSHKTMSVGDLGSQIQSSNKANNPKTVPSGTNQSVPFSATMSVRNIGSQTQSSSKVNNPNTVPNCPKQSVTSPAEMPVRSLGSHIQSTSEVKGPNQSVTSSASMPVGDFGSQIRLASEVNKYHWPYYPNQAVTYPVNMPLRDLGSQSRSPFEVKYHWPHYPNQADPLLCLEQLAETVVSDPRGINDSSFVNSFTTPRIYSSPGYTPTSASSIEENMMNIESGKQESTTSVRENLLVPPPEVSTETQMAYTHKKLRRAVEDAKTKKQP